MDDKDIGLSALTFAHSSFGLISTGLMRLPNIKLQKLKILKYKIEHRIQMDGIVPDQEDRLPFRKNLITNWTCSIITEDFVRIFCTFSNIKESPGKCPNFVAKEMEIKANNIRIPEAIWDTEQMSTSSGNCTTFQFPPTCIASHLRLSEYSLPLSTLQ